MIKPTCIALAILACASAFGQDGRTGVTTNSDRFTVTTDSRPVTRAEAAAAFRLVQGALSRALGVPVKSKLNLSNTDSLVSRDEATYALYQIFLDCKPAFVIKPMSSAYDPRRFRFQQKRTISAASTLASWGCVPPAAPLVVGPKSSLTPAELGDAIGYFIVRIADLTHTPSSRFTPLLKKT